MSVAPPEPSFKQLADDIISQPESQQGKRIFNAVLNRSSDQLLLFLKQAATDISGWGKETAASFLPEPMPLLEESVDLQNTLNEHLVEQNSVNITPLFLRPFDMHASTQADSPFVKAKIIINCALATGVQPKLPYRVELGLEEAPPPSNAKPLVSSSTPRKASQGPSINDTFSLGRKSLGPDLNRDGNRPMVSRNSLQIIARGRRTSLATRNVLQVKSNEEHAEDVKENQLEEKDLERPEGLTDEQWEIQKAKRLRKNDLGRVITKLEKHKRTEKFKDEERHRTIGDNSQDEIAPANDTYYERSKKKQERERKKQEQAEEALRRKRLREENKKKRKDKRRKGAVQRERDEGSEDEDVQEVHSEQEDKKIDQETYVQEETDQHVDSQGTTRQRVDAQDVASHSDVDPPRPLEQKQYRSEVHPDDRRYDYPSHPGGGRYHPSHSMYRPQHEYPQHAYPQHAYPQNAYPQHAYQSASYSSRSNDRHMFNDRNSYHRHYAPGANHEHRPRGIREDPRPHYDYHPNHPGREPSFSHYPEGAHPRSLPPQRSDENGGVPIYPPPPIPMDSSFAPPNDAPYHSPPAPPPPRDFRGYPPHYMGSGTSYYHQDHPSRFYPETPSGPHRREVPDSRYNPNSPPYRYPRGTPFRPEHEFHEGDPSSRR
ncbi:unnamed protein product [Agarophyton chilense]|eukprot:gb/GEZJ01000243.1/.p1 GENE.gb/GEZJ01000243.1/~~gb/GEZJ01000243.1/.p1  ORF type:complete len:657 (+),score=75.28 gb/GEZJ01000243.1/:716-2686(+)